jgi:ubiquinone/menaquinone biosynthesis C-methylase UbiE
MIRSEWIKKKRRESKQRMDVLFAPVYDENWGRIIDPIHQRFVQKMVNLCPPGGTILDAACGTGKYWYILLTDDKTLVGIDQSQGMLERAKDKYPDVLVEKIGLQEMQYEAAFDVIVCVDAMENVFPEDWLLVLNNFYQALKPQGYLYFTVELMDIQESAKEFQKGIEKGLPVVPGESAVKPGYHYYPGMDQVRTWLQKVHFTILEEAEGNEYHHFRVKTEE